MKKTNRILSAILALAMLLTLFNSFAFALTDADIAANDDVILSVSDTGYVEIDYEAALAKAYIIYPEYDGEDYADGDEVDILLGWDYYTIEWDTSRCFYNWEDAFEAYEENLDLTTGEKPVFYFGPGEYEDRIVIPYGAIVLGPNAGFNPNPMTEWDYKVLQNGVDVDYDYNDAQEAIFKAGITRSTRDATWTNTAANAGNMNDPEVIANNKYAFIMEKAEKSMGGARVNLDIIIDGVAIEGGKNVNKDFDIGIGVTDGNELLTVTGHRSNNYYLQNSWVRDNNTFYIEAWDTAKNYTTVYMNKDRFTGLSRNNGGMFGRGIDSVVMADSYFAKATNAALLGQMNANGAGDALVGSGTLSRRDVSLTFKHNFFYDNAGSYMFGTGSAGSWQADPGITRLDFVMDDNILIDASKGAAWGLFLFWLRTIPIYTEITNNVFYEKNHSMNTLFNGGDYQKDATADWNLTFTGNRVLGNINSLFGNMYTNDALAHLRPDFGANYWAQNDGDPGKPVTLKNAPDSGYPNGFNVTTASYYMDAAMTVLNTDMFIESVTGVPGEVTVTDGVAATVSAPNATGVITPVINTVGEGTSVTIYADNAKTEAITTIDLDAISGMQTFPVVITKGDYTTEATLTINLATSSDFVAALENGEIAGCGIENTFVYLPGAEKNDTVSAYWGGEYYDFTCDNYYVFGSLAAIAAVVNDPDAPIEDAIVILPAVEYGDFEAPFAATFAGANYGIDPNVKPDTDEIGADWTLNDAWGAYGETGVGVISIANGVEGKVTFDGITMRANFNDRYRGINRDPDTGALLTQNLDIELVNVVVDHLSTPSIPNTQTYNGVSITGATNMYLWNFNNDRSYSSDEEFLAVYNDTVTIKNVNVKSCKLSTFRWENERHPVETTYDNVYCDFSKQDGGINIFGWLKNTTNRPHTTITYNGCNFRGDPTKPITSAQGNLIVMEGQQAINNDNDFTYDVVFTDNIFYDCCYPVNGSYIQFWPSRTSSVTVTGNVFYSTVRGVAAFNTAAGAATTEASRITEADVTVADNTFAGVVDSFKAIDTANAKGSNNFYTTESALTGYNGKNSSANADEYFWLDAARTLKSTDLAIVDIDAGTSGVENINLNNDATVLNFALIEGTTEGMVIDLTAGATGAWFDADMNPVGVIDSADITGEVTYYYVITLGDAQRVYTVTVMGYIASDFKGNYVQPDGIISDDALLVSSNASNLAAGTIVPYKWDGQVYFFYAGINAFGTMTEALAYAKSNSIAPAEILLTEWSDGAAITLSQSMKVFAPNYDTMPYIADAYGAASDGGDWEENPAYFEKELTVGNISIGAGTNGGVAEIYGVTFTGTVGNSAPSKDSCDRHILLKNVVKNGSATGGASYLFTSSGYNYDNTSSLYVQNMYLKLGGDNNDNKSFRLIGELVYHETTFDGLWMDGVASGHTFNNASYVKPYGDGDVFTFKNCNIRNWYRLSGSPVFSFEPFNKYKEEANGREVSLVFENNILYNVVNSKSAANIVFFLYWYPGAGIDRFVFNDNFLWYDNIKEKVTGFEVSSNNAAFFYSTAATNAGTSATTWPDDDTFEGTAIGNKFINAGSNFDVSSGDHRGAETFTIHDNFTIQNAADIEAAKAGVGINYTCGSYMTRNAPVNFWLDYDMTKSSDVIYDYAFKNDGEKFITDAAAKTIQYLYNEEDGYITETEVVTEPTAEELEENPDAQAVTTYKYTVKLGAAVESNPMGNAMTIAYGDKSANLTGTLTINSDEQIDISSMIFNVTVSSPDGTAEAETYTLSLVESLAVPAGIESITVGDVEATLEGDVYSVTLPADGDDEAIVIVPTEGTEITADASVGSDVSCGAAVEFTITAVNGEDTKTFTLSVIREHTYNEGEITTPATCVATGVRTFTCSTCNDVYEQEIPIDPEAHDYDDGVITTPATCCAEGVMTYTCKNDATHTYEKIIDIDPNAHAWNEGEVTTAATCSTTGVKTYTCANDPAHIREEIIDIDPNAHVWDEGSIITPADCETDGLRAATCTLCGEHADEIVIPATGHDWGEVTYVWAADDSTVTATRVCANNEDHVQTETAEVEVVTVPATCTEAGSTTYTAEFENEAFETQTKTVTIDALNHAWGEPTYVWADDNSTVTATRVCANDATHVETETAEVAVIEVTPASCTAEGENQLTATFENDAFEVQSKNVPVDKLAHTPAEAVRENEVAATCEADGSYDEVVYCTECNAELSRETKTIGKLGHAYGEVKYVWAEDNSKVTATRVCANDETHVETETAEVTVATTAATCTEAGKTVYTATFENEAFAEQSKTVTIDALNHEWSEVKYEWAEDNSKVTASRVCARDAAHVETETVDTVYTVKTAATTAAEGVGVYTATFKNTAFAEQTKEVKIDKLVPTKTFVDVKADAFYKEAVDWAVAMGVTSGTDETHFSPNKDCTRGQVVAFLWRAAGSPEPTKTTHPFTDVKESAFYYKAMLWAVENGITNGLSATTFGPGKTCTRGQVVAFLWRAKGMPKATVTTHSFTDVKAGAFYYKAMLWAVEKDITKGMTATTFAPGKTCTRGQVVTFLYRAYK